MSEWVNSVLTSHVNEVILGTQLWLFIESTSVQRYDVESTLIQRWFNVLCLPGFNIYFYFNVGAR